MNSPTKDEMVKAFAKYCKEDIDEEDANDVAVVFYNAYMEAVSALRKLMANAHIRTRVDNERLRPVDTVVDKSTIDDIKAILAKAPEVK